MRTVRELFANRCSRVLREQHCCSRNPLVRELIREQFANKPSLLCLGIFTKLGSLGAILKNIPNFSEYFAKSSRNLHHILGEQFANIANSSRTVSLKTKRTIMNIVYVNISRTLFEKLFANRISETQTPGNFTGRGGLSFYE